MHHHHRFVDRNFLKRDAGHLCNNKTFFSRGIAERLIWSALCNGVHSFGDSSRKWYHLLAPSRHWYHPLPRFLETLGIIIVEYRPASARPLIVWKASSFTPSEVFDTRLAQLNLDPTVVCRGQSGRNRLLQRFQSAGASLAGLPAPQNRWWRRCDKSILFQTDKCSK